MAAKNVESKEHFEVSWDDDGNRRHQFAFKPDAAQEVARGFHQDHNLSDVQIHRVTTTREQIEFREPEEAQHE
jgi:hypothetical protein